MLTGWRLTVSKWFIIPQRYVVGIMGGASVMVSYTLRVCLNISITQMVKQKYLPIDKIGCSETESHSIHVHNVQGAYGEYDWNEETQGIILGAFYVGYVVMHVPVAMVSETYGAKQILGFGILLAAFLTLLTPAVIATGGDDPTILIILRILEGVGQSPMMPALGVLMARWIPQNERGVFGSTIFGGAQLGNILGTIISGFLMRENGNWPSVFYTFGTIGVIWFVFWELLIYSEPQTHPFISDKELYYLQSQIAEKSELSVPWKHLLRSLPIWAILVASVGYEWGYHTMVIDLPKYMHDILKYSIYRVGLLTALPHLVMWVASFVFAFLCDRWTKRKDISISNARKIFTSLATFLPGIYILVASYSQGNRTLSVVMFCIAMGCMGANFCSLTINVLDLTPNYAGFAYAFINSVTSISGVVTPYVVGISTPDQTPNQWRIAFWVMCVVMWCAGIFYIIFAKGEVQWWNNMEVNADKYGNRIKPKQTGEDPSKQITHF